MCVIWKCNPEPYVMLYHLSEQRQIKQDCKGLQSVNSETFQDRQREWRENAAHCVLHSTQDWMVTVMVKRNSVCVCVCVVYGDLCEVVSSLCSHYCFVRMCTRLSPRATLCPMLQATFISLFGASFFGFISCLSYLPFPVLKRVFLPTYSDLGSHIRFHFFILLILSLFRLQNTKEDICW